MLHDPEFDFQGRTATNLKDKYRNLTKSSSDRPRCRRRPFTLEEDDDIKKGIKKANNQIIIIIVELLFNFNQSNLAWAVLGADCA
jgi:hypothetical protein